MSQTLPSIQAATANLADSAKNQRVALVVQYVGTRFHGWQRQASDRTVQGEIEATLEAVLGHPVSIHGAGRTDAGVHAAAQVAHFMAPALIPAHRWADILNSRLPSDVLIRAAAQVPDDWHAQFSACWRRYRYTLYTDPCPNLFLRPFVWHYYYEPIDTQQVQRALDPLVGYHDLTAFHRSRSGRSHSWVDVQAAECSRQGAFVTVELQANGFLYGMVRLIMGLLVQVGKGQLSVDGFTALWKNRQRDQVKYSAPAQGLCLLRVGYEVFPFAPDIWFDTQPLFCLNTPVGYAAV
ncbi:tRNA pseudouridine(38-40) synthase TruA [Pseudanabaena sp. FACHB-2040]|uniref:tRNA pseudouridine(38-40) synthase TruA n=1 Tax=Pseudanabaena sp. FACHB-2040 TaxID=2692859 RepID=UPI0016896219|nr:tRNA pseudouridine(38-40) synthase TruA [Pseudanabaena sp. FACHB-2040]MBD2258090.1 tRNA pseudouridine(38-40) synthase TruA [Pseudanabaena sp. FACHB-2040]